MNLYAFNATDSIEAHGSFRDFRVGGTSDTGSDDEAGPEIRYLYLNDTTFVDGGKVNATPLFVASSMPLPYLSLLYGMQAASTSPGAVSGTI